MADDGSLPDERFRRIHRILKGREFRQAFADGRRVSGPGLRLVIRENGLGYCRLGLAVSRKVSKHAVVRNRLKRRLRELFRRERPLLPPSVDVVALAQPGVTRRSFTDLRRLYLALIDDYHRRQKRSRRTEGKS